MKMIEGLGEHEAVAVGDNFIVCLGHGFPWSKFADIGGVRKRVSSHSQVIVSRLDNISVVHEGATSKVHIHPETKVPFSHETWQELYNGKYVDYESPTGFTYPSLEEEFEHRKYQQELLAWEVVENHTEETLEKIEFTVVGSMEDTGDDLIETSFHIGRKSFQNATGYPFLVCSAQVACRRFEQLKSIHSDMKFTNGDSASDLKRPYLRYAKVNGHYAFKDEYPFKDKDIRLFKSLEEAKAEVRKIEEMVDACVDLARMVPSLSRDKVVEIWNLAKSLPVDPVTQKIINICEGKE